MFHHGPHAAVRVVQQLRQDVELGQLSPVAHRHFRLHCARVETGRVKDRPVVRAPHAFELVFFGGLRPRHTGAPGHPLRFRIPACRSVAGQDRPPHDGETLDEKRNRQRENAVVRPVPGDVVLLRFVLDHAEAQKRVHFVQVPAHLRVHAAHASDIPVQLMLHQGAIALEPPQHAVQQLPALGIVVAGDDLSKLKKCLGDSGICYRAARVGLRGRREIERHGLVAFVVHQLNLVRLNTVAQQAPRFLAPGGKLGRNPQFVSCKRTHNWPMLADTPASNKPICAGTNTCSGSVTESSSRVGARWSTAVTNGATVLIRTCSLRRSSSDSG